MDFFTTPDTMPAYKQQGWTSAPSGEIPFLGLTLGFTALVFAVELVLDLRQYDKFNTALLNKRIPKELAGIIKQETFNKANDCKLSIILFYFAYYINFIASYIDVIIIYYNS